MNICLNADGCQSTVLFPVRAHFFDDGMNALFPGQVFQRFAAGSDGGCPHPHVCFNQLGAIVSDAAVADNQRLLSVVILDAEDFRVFVEGVFLAAHNRLCHFVRPVFDFLFDELSDCQLAVLVDKFQLFGFFIAHRFLEENFAFRQVFQS